jgi:hypothetical protein
MMRMMRMMMIIIIMVAVVVVVVVVCWETRMISCDDGCGLAESIGESLQNLVMMLMVTTMTLIMTMVMTMMWTWRVVFLIQLWSRRMDFSRRRLPAFTRTYGASTQEDMVSTKFEF